MPLLGTDQMRGKETPLASVIESFLLSSHDLSEKTRTWYTHYFDDFSAWVSRERGREARIGDVDPVIANAYIGEKKTTSKHTGRAAAVTLKRLGSFMAEYGLCATNPLAMVKVPKPPKDVRRPLRDEDIARAIDLAGKTKNPVRDQAIVALLFGCGVRLNECREIGLDDIDWRRKLIVVRSVTSKGERVTRTVRLDQIAARYLDRYIRDVRPMKEGQVWLTQWGKPLTYGGFQQVLDRIGERCAVEGFEFFAHLARISWATNFRRVGAGDVFDLQEEGGWKDLTMPRHYSKAKPVEERSRITPLAGLLQRRVA